MTVLIKDVTFFKNFINLNRAYVERGNASTTLWAVGHVDGSVIMTDFRDGLEEPILDTIKNGIFPLLEVADFINRTNGYGSISDFVDMDAYRQALALAQSMITVPQSFTNKVKGIVFGQAIGDALGFGTEFLSKKRVVELYPNGLNSYEQITRYGDIKNWCPGDWTDDTEQMLCILDSILEKKAVDVKDIAARIYNWAVNDGMGLGQTVHTVVQSSGFLEDPLSLSEKVWEKSGRKWAANGGVMRTSVLAAWNHPFEKENILDAEKVCRITHADPRCTGSCVLVCEAIRSLILGQDDTDTIFAAALKRGDAFHPEIKTYLNKANDSLEALDLDEGLNPYEVDRVGYTLKTLGAAFWALCHAKSFEDGILKVIHEGGDADTNAAVAGAVLGAKFGYEAIPNKWIEGLVYREILTEKAEKLAAFSYRPRLVSFRMK